MTLATYPGRILVALAVLALLGCGRQDRTDQLGSDEHAAIVTERLEPYECGTIARLHTFGGVFLASQPAAEDLALARDGGVVTVIDLRRADENRDFDERRVVEDLGLTYRNPGFGSPEELTDEIFDEVRDLLGHAERPILLHCSSGNRVGTLWMAYRVLDEGTDLEAAVAEAKTVGLRSPVLEEMARDYIARRRND